MAGELSHVAYTAELDGAGIRVRSLPLTFEKAKTCGAFVNAHFLMGPADETDPFILLH